MTPRLEAAIDAVVTAVPSWMRGQARRLLVELIEAIIEAGAKT